MSWWLIDVIVGVVPLWGDCPMRLSHSGIVPSLRLSHSWHCLLWVNMGMPVPYQGDIRCCLCISGCWGPPRYLCGWSTAPSIQVKNLVENLTVFFSSWFAMVGNLFQMCTCVYIAQSGGLWMLSVSFFFFFFSVDSSCLSTVFRFILAWFLFMWLCLSRLLIILVDSTYGPTWLPPDDMRIPDWNQTRMRRSQWKSSTLVCFVVFIFANTRRVVCVIKISAIRLGLGLRRTRTTWLAKPFLSQERSNMHVDSLEHTHFCPLGDYFLCLFPCWIWTWFFENIFFPSVKVLPGLDRWKCG